MSQPDVSRFIEKLLDGVKIEWKALGNVCDVKNGYTPSKSKPEFWTNGTIAWFRMEDIRKNGRVLDNSIQHVASLAVKSGKLFPANSIIISTTATIGEHALITQEFLCNQQLTVLSIKEDAKKILNYKYLFYYSFILGDLCRRNVNPGGFALIGTTKVKRFEIPIPCPDNPEKSLEIQAEIVRILDAFTAMTAELTAELNLRQQQYNHYRDQLLNFDENSEIEPISNVSRYRKQVLDGEEVKWLPVKEVTKYEQPTKYLVKSTNYDDDYATPVLTAGKTFILGYTNEIKGINKASINPVIIFDDFTTANKWVDFDFKAKSSAMKMITSSDTSKYSLKYVYYWLNTLPSELIEGDHKRQWISNYSIKSIPIPCPDNPEKSLTIQAEFVRNLNKFDTLTTSLAEGLPREIELRQQQYEYYRNLLLSFPKQDSEAA
jgi:type I restriction enzyme S subunit